MGTVASNLTRVTAAEAADDANWENIGGGQGSSQSTETFIQGSECRARRVDAGEGGFSFDNTTGVDLSSAGTLVGWWCNVLQPPLIDDATQPFEVRLSSNTSPTADWDGWNVLSSTNYPVIGGWQRVWVAINEVTPDGGAGTPDYTSLRHYGVNTAMGNVGGNALNVLCDAIDYLSGGGAALVLTGASSVFDDFVSADQGTSGNRYGVWQTRSGILFCAVRSQIGESATSVTFADSNAVIAFPSQANTGGSSLLDTDSNGLTFDLQNASTTATLDDSIIRSEDINSSPGDLQIVGTAGSATFTRVTMDGLRTAILTSAATFDRCQFVGCGQVDAGGGANLSASSVTNSEATADTGAVLWDVATDPDGLLDDMTFTKGTVSNHAIEFGTNSPTTLNLNGHSYSGYNASNGQTDSTLLIQRTSGTVTINVTDGDTPSYKSAGATVTINNTVTVKVTVRDEDQNPLEGARVYVQDTAGPFDDNNDIVREFTNASGVAQESFAYTADTNVFVRVRLRGYLPVEQTQTITSTGLDVAVTLRIDPNQE